MLWIIVLNHFSELSERGGAFLRFEADAGSRNASPSKYRSPPSKYRRINPAPAKVSKKIGLSCQSTEGPSKYRIMRQGMQFWRIDSH